MKIITYDLPKQVQLLKNDTTYIINQIRDISKVSPDLATQIEGCLHMFVEAYNCGELTLQLFPVSTELSSAFRVDGEVLDVFYDDYFQLRGVNMKDRYYTDFCTIVYCSVNKS